MKKASILILLLGVFFMLKAQEPVKTIVKFDLKREIDPAARRIVNKGFELAESKHAQLIIIEMNTPGGMLNEADSIRTKIINSKIPVYVLINPNAASAGALISIACNKIYMAKGSTIGAATVVTQSAQALPDKYQSYMRGMMRSTAEFRGRNPEIAESMVGVSKDTGAPVKVLTLTRTEASKVGFCDGEAETIEEMLQKENIQNYKIEELKISGIDKIINFLINPFIHGILILIILGGIYFEMQHPGIGFPLFAAITAAILFFAPLYLEQLAASWEILIFIAGLVLLGLEIFVIPGFGIAGVGGIVLILSGLILSLIRNVYFDFSLVSSDQMAHSLMVVMASFVLTFLLILFSGGKLVRSKAFQNLVLNDSLQKGDYRTGFTKKNLQGYEAIVISDLRPVGKISIENETYEAITEGSMISKGSKVIVIEDSGNKLTVRLKDDEIYS